MPQPRARAARVAGAARDGHAESRGDRRRGGGGGLPRVARLRDEPSRRDGVGARVRARLEARGTHAARASSGMGSSEIDGVTLVRSRSPARRARRRCRSRSAGVRRTDVAEHLARRGVFVSNGDFYAATIAERLGLGADGFVRAGLQPATRPRTRSIGSIDGVHQIAAGRGVASPSVPSSRRWPPRRRSPSACAARSPTARRASRSRARSSRSRIRRRFLARGIAGADGRFDVPRFPHRSKSDVVRIGYRPIDATVPAADELLDLRMRAIASQLATVTTSGRRACPGDDANSQAFQLWGQARSGFLAAVVARDGRPPNLRLRYFRVERDPMLRRVVDDTIWAKTIVGDQPSIAARSATAFASRGLHARTGRRRPRLLRARRSRSQQTN